MKASDRDTTDAPQTAGHAGSGAGERWLLRDDLRFQWIEGSSEAEGYWVVSDPLGRQNYWLVDQEKRLLDLANGARDLGQICRASLELIRPQISSLSSMMGFFIQAKRSGLLRSIGPEGPVGKVAGSSANAPGSSRIFQWLPRLLFFRFPGVHPNRLFGPGNARTFRRQSRMASVPALSIALASLFFVAAMIVIAQFDQLSFELSRAVSENSPLSWLWVLIAIAVLKSIHELAHVYACRSVGAECRELGVMLLVGTPCLYCDVSDLWRIPDSGKRVFVSAAGMIAEMSIAAACVILWAVTYDSTIHNVALVLMTVGSVSTVLVNGNPLLRYDGYFILSDVLGAPNFASHCNGYCLSWIRRLMWGDDAADATAPAVGRKLSPFIQIAYSIAAALYRLMVVGLIAWAVYQVLGNWGMEWLGMLVLIALPMGLLHRFWTLVAKPPESHQIGDDGMLQRRRAGAWWKHRRARLVGVGAILFGVLVLNIPVSRSIQLPMIQTARDAQAVYAGQTGRLSSWVEGGSPVESGDILIQLTDDVTADRLERARGEVSEARASLNDWQRRKGSQAGTAERVLLAQQRLEVAETKLKRIEKEQATFSLRARAAGVWVRNDSAPRWELGQWVQEGTLVGWVRDGGGAHVTAYANAAAAQSIRVGQEVTISHPSIARGTIDGRVTRIATTPQQDRDADLFEVSQVMPNGRMVPERKGQSGIPGRWTGEARYPIEIQCGTGSTVDLVIGSVGRARIHVEPMSMWARIRRLFAELLRPV